MPNVVSSFRNLDCSKSIYWGTSAGKSHYFGDYFRGLAYAMSWPLVSASSVVRLSALTCLGFVDWVGEHGPSAHGED